MPWRTAMEEALYGVDGFYRTAGAAARHFRTSVHVSPHFAGAIVRLLGDVDAALGRPGHLDVVDMGAGDGRLLYDLDAQAPPGLRERLRPMAVDLGPRPGGLPSWISWMAEPPDGISGLIIANEWLDNVPVDVVEQTEAGPRLVLVETATGEEQIADRPREQDMRWLAAWWPLAEPGDRAEVGWPRDDAWAELVRRLQRGLVIAIDYGHRKGDRPPYGSLTGYRDGRQVVPVPDGSCDLTAHVALDACAARTGSHLTTQRAALKALGISGRRPQPTGTEGQRPQPKGPDGGRPQQEGSDGGRARTNATTHEPPNTSARTGEHAGTNRRTRAHEPADTRVEGREYLRRLRAASEEGELIDPYGLGGFGWLVHAKGIPVPGLLRGTING